LQVGCFHIGVIEHLGCQRYGTVLLVMWFPMFRRGVSPLS